jgi:hypothetical protein
MVVVKITLHKQWDCRKRGVFTSIGHYCLCMVGECDNHDKPKRFADVSFQRHDATFHASNDRRARRFRYLSL